MAFICDICGKATVVGSSQKHKRGVAGKRWKNRVTKTPRLFRPNIHKKTLVVSGKEVQMKVCSKCLKRIKRDGKVRDYSNVAVL